MRAVLDTVVLLRALINPHSSCGRIAFELSDKYVTVISPETVKELLGVLARPVLQRRFPQIAEALSMRSVLDIIQRAEFVEPADEPRVCRDPNDDKFFACALVGAVTYIVSEDKGILDVREFEGVRTITAREFIDVLTRS